MKKIIFLLILAVSFSIVAIGVGGVVYAEVSESESDQVFIATLNDILPTDNEENLYVCANKTLVSDLNFKEFGYIYEFNINGDEGFAIIINTGGVYECVEIYFDAKNPYKYAIDDSLLVYVNIMTYWVYSDEVFYNAQDGKIIPDFFYEAATQKAYYSTVNSMTIEPEYINYMFRSQTNYKMVNRHPTNVTSTASSSCVPTMGANIIQYYDRYATNLIVNYEPGNAIATLYRYKAPSYETNQVASRLTGDMGAGVNGATIQQFVNGMTKYCNERNYNIAFESCMINNIFSYTTAKDHVQAGLPVAVFLDPYSIEIITEYQDYDLIEHSYFNAPHAMAMFGFRDITYTLNNGQIRKDSYIQVATGNDLLSQGYCKLTSYSIIDQALAIYIS